MKQFNRVLLFVLFACVLGVIGCGSSGPAEEAEAVDAGPAPPSAEAVAAAQRLNSQLGTNIQLVPTVRGLAEIGYEQPNARRDGNFIVTNFRVQNLAENAIAG